MVKVIPKNKLKSILFFIGLILLTPIVKSKLFIDELILPKDFYFIVVTGILFFSIIIYFIFKTGDFKIKLNKIDILVCAFLLLYILRFVFNKNDLTLYYTELYKPVYLIVFYFLIKYFFKIFKKENKDNLFIYSFVLILIIIATIEAISGIYQFSIGFTLPRGSFDNTGPYTNYIVFIAVLLLGNILFENINKQSFKIISIVLFTALLIILALSKARASWIALLISSIVFLQYKYNFIARFKNAIHKIYLRILILIILIVVLAFSLFALYNMKSESVNGRIFIWKTSLKIITEKPVFGYGPGKFLSARNNYQAEYFKKNYEISKEKSNAANLEFAFNDFIQITAETGIVGLIIFLLLIVLILQTKNSQPYILPFKFGLITILITSLFSYPLQRISMQMLFFFIIAILSLNSNNTGSELEINKMVKRIILLIFLILNFYFLFISIKTVKANIIWKQKFKFYQEGKIDMALLFYSKLYPLLKNNAYFLYNYGTILSVNGAFEKSNKILSESNEILYDSDVFTFIGDNNLQMGIFDNAEKAYLQAVYLLPNKLLPKYRLIFLYEQQGKIENALYWANDILSNKPKGSSTLIYKILKDVSEFVNKYSKSLPNEINN